MRSRGSLAAASRSSPQLAAASGSESRPAAQSHRSTRAGGQDDVSSKQTPSNKQNVFARPRSSGGGETQEHLRSICTSVWGKEGRSQDCQVGPMQVCVAASSISTCFAQNPIIGFCVSVFLQIFCALHSKRVATTSPCIQSWWERKQILT